MTGPGPIATINPPPPLSQAAARRAITQLLDPRAIGRFQIIYGCRRRTPRRITCTIWQASVWNPAEESTDSAEVTRLPDRTLRVLTSLDTAQDDG